MNLWKTSTTQVAPSSFYREASMSIRGIRGPGPVAKLGGRGGEALQVLFSQPTTCCQNHP